MNELANISITINFIKVLNTQAKLQILNDIVVKNFLNKKKCIIFTDNQAAAVYVDNLLWKFSKDSFIPHLITDEPSQEFVIITTKKDNLNQAEVAINLTALPLDNVSSNIREIFELHDSTTQEKEIASNQKLESYNSRNFHCLQH